MTYDELQDEVGKYVHGIHSTYNKHVYEVIDLPERLKDLIVKMENEYHMEEDYTILQYIIKYKDVNFFNNLKAEYEKAIKMKSEKEPSYDDNFDYDSLLSNRGVNGKTVLGLSKKDLINIGRGISEWYEESLADCIFDKIPDKLYTAMSNDYDHEFEVLANWILLNNDKKLAKKLRDHYNFIKDKNYSDLDKNKLWH